MSKDTAAVKDETTTPAVEPREQFEVVFVQTPEELEKIPHHSKARECKLTNGKKVVYAWATQANSLREAYARKELGITVELLNPKKRAAATPAEKTLNQVAKLSHDEQLALMEKLKAQLLGTAPASSPDTGKNKPTQKGKK